MKKLEMNQLAEAQGGNCFLAGAGLALSFAGGPLGVLSYASMMGGYLSYCWQT